MSSLGYNRSVLDWPDGVTVYEPEKCYNGCTIVNPYRSETIFLVDMVGRVVHIWKADYEKRGESWFTRRLPSGNWMSLIYRSKHLEDASSPARDPDSFSCQDFESEVVEFDWDGNVVWRYSCSRDWNIHHDMARLQNGDTLILMEKEAKVRNISDKLIAENFFIEVDPQQNIVWEWYTTNHFDEFGYSKKAKHLMYEHGRDIFHTNTLSVLPGNELGRKDKCFTEGNILSCQRNTNLIYIIDKQSKEVVWKWGDGHLVGPHHPVMLANGNILIYDNGGQAGYPLRCRPYTRLVQINPISEEIVWQYSHEPYFFKPTSKFFSSSWGSVQCLPNGNIFSLDCHKGRLFEVTPSGEIVWEYISPFVGAWGGKRLDRGIYRAYRYGYDKIPEVESIFKNTDGHLKAQTLQKELPNKLGLPSDNLP